MKSKTQTTLYAVTGMSPAILTETVWALAHEKVPVIPDRVIVATTITGRQVIERELLTPADKPHTDLWNQLRLAILGKHFQQDERLILEPVHLITTPNPRNGRTDWLEDIRTPEENRAAADFLLDDIRTLTENPDTQIIASIAGGRKTMGALLYACMTLIGRETDRLTHVLVTDPFDDPRLKPKFYYPAQSEKLLTDSNGKTHKPVQAKIELADIPFVPLRNAFRDLGAMPGTFASLVQRYTKDLRKTSTGPAEITLDIEGHRIIVDDVEIPASNQELWVLDYLLTAHETKSVPIGQQECADPLAEFLTTHPNPKARAWNVDADKIKRSLSVIRGKLRKKGSHWNIPERSIKLPPFKRKK